jgi:hypothetical protein
MGGVGGWLSGEGKVGIHDLFGFLDSSGIQTHVIDILSVAQKTNLKPTAIHIAHHTQAKVERWKATKATIESRPATHTDSRCIA